jgi:hypothetical protein
VRTGAGDVPAASDKQSDKRRLTSHAKEVVRFYVYGRQKRGCPPSMLRRAIRISIKPSSPITTFFSHAAVIERTVATSEQT